MIRMTELYQPNSRGNFLKGPSSLVRKVKHFLDRQGLHPAPVVVAVSGGPDSVALLCVLICLNRQDEAASNTSNLLTIAHLNHQLRGAESDADESFVRELY